MRYLQKLEVGVVYFLEDYTAPKVFTGLFFECLLTEQKIAADCKAKSTDLHWTEWENEIFRPERFAKNY